MEYIVFIDLREERLETICTLLAVEFGTIGVKALEHKHLMLPFRVEENVVRVNVNEETIEMTARVKYLEKDGRVLSLKAEYEDVKALAAALADKGLLTSFSKLKGLVEAEAFVKVLEGEKVAITIK